MLRRQTTFSPLLRFLAALALVGFVAAQALCRMHCSVDTGRGDSVRSCCTTRKGQACHDAPMPSTPSATTTCSTLKTMLAGGDTTTLVTPPVHTLYFLAPAPPELVAQEPQPEASYYRQAWTRNWVFTSVVCLGPAFRSLAPPCVS